MPSIRRAAASASSNAASGLFIGRPQPRPVICSRVFLSRNVVTRTAPLNLWPGDGWTIASTVVFPFVCLNAITSSIGYCGAVDDGTLRRIQSPALVEHACCFGAFRSYRRSVCFAVDCQSCRARFKTALKMCRVIRVNLSYQAVDLTPECIGAFDAQQVSR